MDTTLTSFEVMCAALGVILLFSFFLYEAARNRKLREKERNRPARPWEEMVCPYCADSGPFLQEGTYPVVVEGTRTNKIYLRCRVCKNPFIKYSRRGGL